MRTPIQTNKIHPIIVQCCPVAESCRIMLSGLIEYIWGPDGNNQNMEKENSPDGDDRHSDHDQFEIVLLEVNETIGDDWVYIEQQEKPLQAITDVDDNASIASEGSWIVTPPECFTRRVREEPEQNELEDLLIEHPSMSVYNMPPHQPHARVVARDLAPVQGNRTEVSSSNLLEPAICQETYPHFRSTRTGKRKDKLKALKRHNLTHVHWSKNGLHQRKYTQRGIMRPRKH